MPKIKEPKKLKIKTKEQPKMQLHELNANARKGAAKRAAIAAAK